MPPKGRDVRGLCWRKSSKSIGNGACVEVAPYQEKIAVRSSRDPNGDFLAFERDEWCAFLVRVKAHEFDPPASG